MNHLMDIAATLWPPLLMIGLFAIFLMTASELGFGRPVVAIGSVAAIGGLVVLYQISIVRNAVRWGVTLFGLAAPMALGVIAIRYIVEET